MWNGVVCDWGCVCLCETGCVCVWLNVFVCDRGPGSVCPPASETEFVSACVSDRIYMTEFVCDFGRVCVWVPLSLNVSMVEYVLLNVSSWSVEFPWGSVCMAVCICVRVCVTGFVCEWLWATNCKCMCFVFGGVRMIESVREWICFRMTVLVRDWSVRAVTEYVYAFRCLSDWEH